MILIFCMKYLRCVQVSVLGEHGTQYGYLMYVKVNVGPSTDM